ncbi:hypothetical protein LOAG_14399 [Loa loa]|uniref:G-protein coupled receptors family 1 profile domain-containing protein n=1 Tax=Loa loa TaxID=7209 RepID=A0A1S0THT7_LOALO|nr:hypothetical protein LOAG_14399 [Loa loa]EFO14124.1 hypothetical protein LOAG_14399 [Loa loa]
MKKKFYIPAMILPPLLYSFTLLILVYIYNGNSDDEVICGVSAVYIGRLRPIWGISSTLINLATIILYVILSRVVVKAKTTTRNFELFQTLKIIVAFIGLGHLTTMVIFMSTVFLDIPRMTKYYVAYYGGIFINISVSCNWLFYYWRSTEYRNEFKRQLKKLPCLRDVVDLQPKCIAHKSLAIIHRQISTKVGPKNLPSLS